MMGKRDQRKATIKLSGDKSLVEDIITLLENDFNAIRTSNMLPSPDGVHIYLAIIGDRR